VVSIEKWLLKSQFRTEHHGLHAKWISTLKCFFAGESMQVDNGQIFGENRSLQFLAAAPGAADHSKLCFGQSARGHEIDGSLAGLRLRAWGSILAT